MNVKCVYGPPCSGKTTLVSKSVGEMDLVFDYDRILRALSYRDIHTLSQHPAHPFVMGCRKAIITRLFFDSDIETAWIITTYPTDTLTQQMDGLPVEYVRMETSLEECLERLEHDDSRPDKSEWEKVIRTWFEEHGGESFMEGSLESRCQRQMRCLSQRFETREAENGDLHIEGYFSVFNSSYELWEGASEIVKPGAFDACLTQDVRALINHDSTLVLGRTKAGTLTLKQDERGLWGSIRINRDDVDAMNLYARVQRGDVDQCSFGFDIERETFVDLGGGACRWEIEKVNPLYEVSVCTFPAYEDTGVSARKRQLEDIEKRRADAWRENMRSRIGGK